MILTMTVLDAPGRPHGAQLFVGGAIQSYLPEIGSTMKVHVTIAQQLLENVPGLKFEDEKGFEWMLDRQVRARLVASGKSDLEVLALLGDPPQVEKMITMPVPVAKPKPAKEKDKE